MSHSYMITLTPIEPYFFGGELTFGTDDTRDGGSRYSAVSTYFPQQSALLGMLRKTLLIQSDCLTLHRKGEWVDKSRFSKAVSISGKGQFSYEDEYDLGMIEQVSPLFIIQKDNYYLPDAKDQKLSPKLTPKCSVMLGNSEQPCLVFEGYNPKEYSELILISSDGKIRKSVSEMIQTIQSVGIKKSYSGEAQEDAFFQKTSFMLRDKASFGCILTLKDELHLDETIVSLGADHSSFKLSAYPFDTPFDQLFSHAFEPKGIDRVVVTSETLLTLEAQQNALFILGERKSFRYLRGETGSPSKGKKSKRYFLLERGSVIYASDIEKLVSHLHQPHLQKAGINHFITIKGDK